VGPRCRGPAGLDAGHHVGHYAGVTRLIALPGSEVAHHPTKAGYKPVHMLNAELCVENLS